MKSRYLGEATPALRSRLAQAADLNADALERGKTMARLARMLRAEDAVAEKCAADTHHKRRPPREASTTRDLHHEQSPSAVVSRP